MAKLMHRLALAGGLILFALSLLVGADTALLSRRAIVSSSRASSAKVLVWRGGDDSDGSKASSLLHQTGQTMVSAAVVFGILGIYEILEGVSAARQARAAGSGKAGAIGVLIQKSLHGVMDELVTGFLLWQGGVGLLELDRLEEIGAKNGKKAIPLEQGLTAIQAVVKRLRGATIVLLVKKLAEAVLIHMGYRGIGPQLLTPLFRHLVGHHHSEIAMIEGALHAGHAIEDGLDAFIRKNRID